MIHFDYQMRGLVARLALLLAIFLASDRVTRGVQPADRAGHDTTTADRGDVTPADLEFFEKQVRPLLVDHCYECHAGEERDGGLRLDSRDALFVGGDSGPAVVAGKPDESRIVEAIRYRNLDLQMPPGGRLSTSQVQVLEEWVRRGAPDPRVGPLQAAPPAPTGMSLEVGRKFWSFRPLTDPTVPSAAGSEWVRTPIDAFVLDRLRDLGSDPAPPADKRTLLRRVTFDLTGVPPNAAEWEAFQADDSPDAFDRVVERLLASPQYGERWGRHWLDVARYADSNGMDENLAFGNAWRYRDYVISVFNEDLPFDRFLIEQIAGDLLPDADPDTKTATGFLALGAKVLAEPDHDKLVMDIIDEQLDAIGKSFLGMSLGCVRCHDHKFDPIKQSDYYALAAIFKSTRTLADTKTGAIHHWHEHSFADQEQLQDLKQVDAAIGAKKSAANRFKSQSMAAVRSTAVGHAAVYLAAASQFRPDASLRQVSAVAEPLGLHPRILHHCRLHLEYHRDEPLWQEWHRLVREGHQPEEIEVRFQSLFTDPKEASTQESAESVHETPADESLPRKFGGPAKDELRELAQAALQDTSGFLAVPAKPEFAFDPATLTEYHRLAEEARVAESVAPDEPAAMGVEDAEVLIGLPIHIRGSHRNLGESVPRGFPAVMLPSEERCSIPDDQSGRLELARWMADPHHPLAARVYVNRIWRWHFGRGIVASTENFGVLGDRPSHPELLDWLANRFIRSGWSTKQLHRLILSSSVYQQASSHPEEARLIQADPENHWLWRFSIRRLEAEPLRDSILAVSGQLDTTMGGKSIPLRNRQFVFDHTSIDHTDYDSRRRAVYLPIIRNHLYSFLEQFDLPDPTMPSGDRAVTVIAPQALWMMNDDLVMDAAGTLAEQAIATSQCDEERVSWIYWRVLTRNPSESERDRAHEFLTQVGHERGRAEAWMVFCQALLSSNEFSFVD